jgi:small subunit ribosomal protein S8
MQDPVSDMLTRIRNAHHRSKPEVTMPASKLKASVAQVLQDEGYIGGFNVSEEVKPSLTIELKYFEGKPVIEEITRISKPSLRQYVGSNDLPKVRSGLGIASCLHQSRCDD